MVLHPLPHPCLGGCCCPLDVCYIPSVVMAALRRLTQAIRKIHLQVRHLFWLSKIPAIIVSTSLLQLLLCVFKVMVALFTISFLGRLACNFLAPKQPDGTSTVGYQTCLDVNSRANILSQHTTSFNTTNLVQASQAHGASQVIYCYFRQLPGHYLHAFSSAHPADKTL